MIWIYWAFLWTLFFLLLGLKLDGLTAYTGWATAIEGIVTGFVPAMLILTGYWPPAGNWSQNTVAITLGAVGAAMVLVLIPLTRPRLGPARPRTPGRAGPRCRGTGGSFVIVGPRVRCVACSAHPGPAMR